MAITPEKGYIVDPSNPNAVIPDPNAQVQAGGVPATQPQQQPSQQGSSYIFPATQANPSTLEPQTQTTATQTQQTQQNQQPSSTDVSQLQDYLVQQGYMTAQQMATGPGTYGPQTTAAVAKMYQQMGLQVPQSQQEQSAIQLAQKYQNAYQSQQGQAPQSAAEASSALQPYLQPAQSSDPVFNSMVTAMAPIMDSLNQVMQNINNPALGAVSLQQEYNQLQQQYNLPQMNAQLMNMSNIMSGSEQDIRDEITSAGGLATDSQVMGMTAARNKVILKQYNALATQYQAAQTNVQNMMQYATTDQQTQLARSQATAGITESMASIYAQMQNMALTIRQNAVSSAQYNITQTGYQAFAKTLQGNPQMQGYYEQLLNLAPGTLSNPQALQSLDTYKQQSLQMTNLLRDTQLYNAGLINALPSSDIPGGQGTSTTNTGQYGTATSSISQMTGIDPSTPLSQVNPQSLLPGIIQNEGGSPQGVANNPGNIKYAGLPGQINSGIPAQDGGTFASYATPQAGQQAVLGDIQAAIQNNPNQTLGQFIDKYTNTAPTSGIQNPGITTPPANAPVNGLGTQAYWGGTLIDPSQGPNGAVTSQAITSVTGLSPDEFNYLVKGQPALTRMPYGQQRQVKAAVQTFLNKNGVDLSTFQSQYTAYNTTLSNNISRFNNTQIAEGEVNGTIKNLNASAINNGLGSVNLANVAKILTGQQVNDPAANEYAFYLNDLTNSLGYFYAAQQGKSSADIPDTQEAAQVIVGGLSSGGIQGLQTAINQTTLKMKGVLGEAVDNAQQNVWDLFGVGDKYTPQYQEQAQTYQATYNGITYDVDSSGNMTPNTSSNFGAINTNSKVNF